MRTFTYPIFVMRGTPSVGAPGGGGAVAGTPSRSGTVFPVAAGEGLSAEACWLKAGCKLAATFVWARLGVDRILRRRRFEGVKKRRSGHQANSVKARAVHACDFVQHLTRCSSP